MADTNINQMITLGIGTPADIPHFILFGLTTKCPGVIDVTLYERDFGSATLYERDFGSATLNERP